MTRVITIAPTPIDFAITPGAGVSDPVAYASYWAELARACEDPAFEFSHAGDLAGGPRYRSLRSDSLDRPLHVIHGQVGPAELRVATDEKWADLWSTVEQVNFWLHDHSVLMVELTADVHDWLGVGGGTTRLDELQEGIIELSHRASEALVIHRLRPLLQLARRLDREANFIMEAVEGDVEPAPWWVARTLVMDPQEPRAANKVGHWLAASSVPEEVESFLSGGSTHVARWLNYVHAGVTDDTFRVSLTPEAGESWRAMRYAQYFYAALDQIDGRLDDVLAEATAGRRGWEVEELGGRLRILSHRAERVMLDLQVLRKYVTRPVLAEVDRILDVWNFEDLVEKPVHFKIGICDRRINDINNNTQARAATVTDVILLGIAVTSVLATALALTDFGRSIAADPGQAGFGSTTSGLTEWFAAQPADAILIGSILISSLIVLLFLAVRRSGPS